MQLLPADGSLLAVQLLRQRLLLIPRVLLRLLLLLLIGVNLILESSSLGQLSVAQSQQLSAATAAGVLDFLLVGGGYSCLVRI